MRGELRRVEAVATAGRLLRHRDLAADRLEGELGRRGVAPAQRREAVGALSRAGLVDDRRLATTRAAALAGRGYGDEAIRWRLTNEGIADELVEEALAALEPEQARASEILRRDGVSARTLRGLLRRGFSGETVESVAPIADLGGPALR